MDEALRSVTKSVIDNTLEQLEEAADPEGDDPKGHHANLAYLNWVAQEVDEWREIVMRLLEDPPDVTGNPWPDCICNDARYELGHMESCPAYGRPPDAPDEAPEP
jgi:hypothetical protein